MENCDLAEFDKLRQCYAVHCSNLKNCDVNSNGDSTVLTFSRKTGSDVWTRSKLYQMCLSREKESYVPFMLRIYHSYYKSNYKPFLRFLIKINKALSNCPIQTSLHSLHAITTIQEERVGGGGGWVHTGRSRTGF